ncbi:MAG: GGDEF domain-containing protein [Burkholderiaceae bacterium]|nr:GGDEF domain-containing protein [Burkholderiaceae bacterium]
MPFSALDLRVFIVINGVMACLMALVLYSQSRTYPKTIQGLDQWAHGQLVAFFSTVLFGLQGALHPVLSMGAANVLLLMAGGYLLSGTCRHYGKPLPQWFFPALLVMSIPVMVVLSDRVDYYLYRVLFVCTTLAVLLALHAWVMWKHGGRTFAARFMLVVLVLLTAIMAGRAATALAYPLGTSMFTLSPMQALYLGGFSFGLLLMSIGAILLASERLRQELEHLASNDSLTGAFTRRALYELGENEVARCERLGTQLSALMLDLDHFKKINDQFGHYVGDLVLSDFVQRTQGILRRPSILGRYGGEEFVALLPDTDRAEALRVADRIRNSLSTNPDLPRCEVSIGMATFEHSKSDTLRDLIARADTGLYRAKELGRNRVEEARPVGHPHPVSAQYIGTPG